MRCSKCGGPLEYSIGTASFEDGSADKAIVPAWSCDKCNEGRPCLSLGEFEEWMQELALYNYARMIAKLTGGMRLPGIKTDDDDSKNKPN